MSARDDYGPTWNGADTAERMFVEIDQLRAVVAELNPFRHDHNPLNADFHGGTCPACEWWSDMLAVYGPSASNDVKEASSSQPPDVVSGPASPQVTT